MSYIFHTDAGHGWLAVKRKELRELGIENKISGFSFQKGDTVYLEEDCDASTFIKAKVKTPEDEDTFKSSIKESYVDRSPIRSYQHYECLTEKQEKLKNEIISKMLERFTHPSDQHVIKTSDFETLMQMNKDYNLGCK